MITERTQVLIRDIISHLNGFEECRKLMVDEHELFVRVVDDAINRGVIEPWEVDLSKMTYRDAAKALRAHVEGLVGCYTELIAGEDPEKKEVTK